jgi:hypothetical protein
MRTTESGSIRVIYAIVSGSASKILHSVPALSRWSVGAGAASLQTAAARPRRRIWIAAVQFRNIPRAHSVLRLGGGAVTNAKKVHRIRTAQDCPSSVVSRPVQGMSSDLARRRSGPFLFARMLDEMGHAVLDPLAGGQRRLRRGQQVPACNALVGFVAASVLSFPRQCPGCDASPGGKRLEGGAPKRVETHD